MKLIKHFITITRHRHKVMWYCLRSGLIWQGLCHDLSKYSFTEFFRGVKYYQGTYSPHHNERQAKGYSDGWMHHKGRNKHHAEYWIDMDLKLGKYMPVEMPNKYIAESICDRIAASKIYNKKKYTKMDPLNYFINEGDRIPMHPKTREKFMYILKFYSENGEKKTFKYLKKFKKERY